ncbi:MAG: hypothetical protein ACK4HD_05010 [Pannonibacter phragmitetus]
MNDALLRERIETLLGERPRAMEQSAVRIADLRPILSLKPDLRSGPASGAAPTKSEFDALVRDLHDTHQLLRAVSEALRQRLLT